jgi:carbamoyltransferase
MLILGFNSTHDASAALVRDGAVVGAVEEERLSRRKHHYGFPERALDELLRAAGARFEDLDHAAFYWNPRRGLVRFGLHVLRHLPGSLAYFRRQPGIFRDFLALPRLLRDRYGFRGRFHFVDHHLAHAASAYYLSGFDDAAILTVDGTGEWTTTFLARGQGDAIVPLEEVRYPHSLGKVYEALTQYLGFRPLSGEGKVMGLASYGRPSYREAFERILPRNGHWDFRVDTGFFRYQLGNDVKYSDRLVELLGPPRAPESAIEPRHQDIAASLQERIEEEALRLAAHLHRRAPSRNLCLAGGVALNCVMNGRLLRESGFREVFVCPAAGDAGSALGAALEVHRRVAGRAPRATLARTDLGPAFGEEECAAALRAAGVPFTRERDVTARTAELLAGGRVVGWFQGRMEYGPRALGQRSILADPRDPAMKDTVNLRVKRREGFRPFAPAVPLEDADRFFEDARPSPFMLFAFRVRPEARALLGAVTHVDGTARVQTVDAREHPRFHRLLRAFGARTGVPVLLNTSMNVRGEPLVCRPEEAVACFLGTELDALVLGDLVAVKP